MTITKHPRVVIRPPNPTAVIAERTRFLASGEIRTWEETVYLYVEDIQGRSYARLVGGPTGKEAFELTAATVQRFQNRGWIACEGRVGGPDRLVVPVSGIRTFFAMFGIFVEGVEEAA